jgi:N-acetylmuramoyl-L-alanine amidase/cell wall-associated NlpC family hydrolase
MFDEEQLNRLEPIPGKPGWLVDPQTGKVFNESDFIDNRDNVDNDDYNNNNKNAYAEGRDKETSDKGDQQDVPTEPKEESISDEKEKNDTQTNNGEGGEPPQKTELGEDGSDLGNGEVMPTAEGGFGDGLGWQDAVSVATSDDHTEAAKKIIEREAKEEFKRQAKKKLVEAGGEVSAELLLTIVGIVLLVLILIGLVGTIIMAIVGYGDESSITEPESGTGITIICLDAGHGGADPGATNGAFKESEMNLKIVLELKPKLENAGYKIVTTRLNNDYLDANNNSAEESRARSEYCSNEGANLMYRVHLDASTSPQKTFHIAPRPDQTNIYDVSLSYAQNIHSKMISALGSLVVGGGSPITDGGVLKESVDYQPSNPLQGNIKANELNLPIIWLEALAINNAGISWIENASNRDSLTTAIVEGFLEAIPPETGSFGDNVLAKARTQLGKPYVWGGCHTIYKDPAYENGCPNYDCSGFSSWSWWWGSNQTVTIDENTSALWANKNDSSRYIYFTDISQAQAGDLVLKPSHVGIYIGDSKYIHAPSTGDVVKEAGVGTVSFFLRPITN